MKSVQKFVHRFGALSLCAAVVMLAGSLFAQFVQSTDLGGPGGGFAVAERSIGVDECGGGTGTAVDPTNPDAFYTFDGLSIRRSVIGGPAQGEVVFTPPPGINVTNFQGGVYGSFVVFNPTNQNELWFGESSDRNLYVITLANGSRTTVSASRVAYTSPPGFNIYDVAFDTSSATTLIVAVEGNFATSNLMRIEVSPGSFASTQIGAVAGASGPVDFDTQGNLYYVIPPFSGAGPLAGDQAKLIRWTAATVAAAQPVGGTPLDETNADPTAERLFTFNSTPGVFASISSIVTRIEGGRPIVYAGNNDPQNRPDPSVTGGIMRIDIEQAASNDNHFWARVQNNAVPGKLAVFNRTATFSANAGQWDEGLSQFNGRLYAMLTTFGDVCFGAGTVSSQGAVAMILPNNTLGEISSLAVVSHPTTEYALQPIQPTIEIRDAGGNRISSGTAGVSQVAVTIANGPAGATLTGTTTSNTVNGTATFGAGYQLGTSGQYTLQFTAGATMVQQNFNIVRIESIGVVSFPTSVQINQTFTASVELLDGDGQRITAGIGSTANVILSVQTGPNGGTLTQTVAAVNGLADFSGLQLGVTGSYTLSFNAFIGAISQAQENVNLTVQPQVLLNTGGGGCTASVGGSSNRGLPVSLAALALLGGLLVVMRRRSAGHKV